MNVMKLSELREELAQVRQEAVAASISGDQRKADCLTGKAVGMKSTIEIAERVRSDESAKGELEGMERVLTELSPLPKC